MLYRSIFIEKQVEFFDLARRQVSDIGIYTEQATAIFIMKKDEFIIGRFPDIDLKSFESLFLCQCNRFTAVFRESSCNSPMGKKELSAGIMLKVSALAGFCPNPPAIKATTP